MGMAVLKGSKEKLCDPLPGLIQDVSLKTISWQHTRSAVEVSSTKAK